MNSGFYRFNIGEFECTVIDADTEAWASEDLLSSVPEDLRMQALQASGCPAATLELGYNYLMIGAGERRLLVDSGSGNDNFLQNMRSAGVEPDHIDTMLITHADSDHIGGLIDPEEKIVFTNARHLMLREARELYSSESFLKHSQGYWADFARNIVPLLKELVELIEPGVEILPGIRVIGAPGHRAGHCALQIYSGDSNLLHVSDAIHHPVFLAHPTWLSDFDEDPGLAKQTRSRLFSLADREQSLVFVSHFAYPGLGYLVSEGDIWRWQPLIIQNGD